MARKPGSKPPGKQPVDDVALFRQVMRDVEPLRRKPLDPLAIAETPVPDAMMPAPVRAPSIANPANPANAPSFGVDRRTTVRLRRGQIRPAAKLDLHGMTQIEAHGALASFIRGARAAGHRCVLIVTGKGSMTTGGVLRREVPRWLGEPRLRSAILSVNEAQPKDGGAGALYVLLRRKSKG